MSFTLHYGGVGRAFTVADYLPGEDDERIPYNADALMQDIKACVDRGGDWHPVLLARGGMVVLWFGAGVPMYITERSADEDLADVLAGADTTGAVPSWGEVLDLDASRHGTEPSTGQGKRPRHVYVPPE